MKITRTDLDTADILAACVNYVPVNARVDQAIAAHRIAFKASQGDPGAQWLSENTLHAVVLSVIATVEDGQAVFDYLEALPADAWPEHPDHSAAEFREATLAGFRRVIAWRQAG